MKTYYLMVVLMAAMLFGCAQQGQQAPLDIVFKAPGYQGSCQEYVGTYTTDGYERVECQLIVEYDEYSGGAVNTCRCKQEGFIYEPGAFDRESYDTSDSQKEDTGGNTYIYYPDTGTQQGGGVDYQVLIFPIMVMLIGIVLMLLPPTKVIGIVAAAGGLIWLVWVILL